MDKITVGHYASHPATEAPSARLPTSPCGECARLRAENEELRRDAERYRWLRDELSLRDVFDTRWLMDNGLMSADLDTAIDAALRGEGE